MDKHMCPWWVGYLLVSPLRKTIQNPIHVIGEHVKKGMKVIDFGCAMGYFSLPIAEITGEKGKTICIDIQEKMLNGLKKRARKKGLIDKLEIIQCSNKNTGIERFKEEIDFAMAFAVIHEVEDEEKVLQNMHTALKNGGKFLIADPTAHVSKEKFEQSIEKALKIGYTVVERPRIKCSMAVILQKNV